MGDLTKQVSLLAKKVAGLSTVAKAFLFGGVFLLVLAALLSSLWSTGAAYQYAFTNLTPEDAGEAATQMKTAGIAFRLEAGGTALAVPASQVYDARLLLAAAGIPRGGGVGFEIFDKGDLGVSEFTQHVNLRRATEGELARTIGRLAAIRSARVHITMTEKGLYRDEDRKATAAVVVNLQPGRTLADREAQGIRHLVASAVPGLSVDSVTIVDGRGAVLAGETSGSAKALGEEHDLERNLEGRIVDMLEKAMGAGAVVAKVTASMDGSEVETTADAYDPESATVRSERHTNEQNGQDTANPGGVAGAAANQPMVAAGGAGSTAARSSSQREDEVKNYEISKTVTHTVTRAPRLKRLSIAVLIDGKDGKPRPQAEVARMADLAKSAVGFDATRGDKFEITSTPFSPTEEAGQAAPITLWSNPVMKFGALGGAGLLLLVIIAAVLMVAMRKRRGGGAAEERDTALLQPGARVAELEAIMTEQRRVAQLPAMEGSQSTALVDPNVGVRDRARKLTEENPERAANLLRAWIQSDHELQEAA